MTNPVQNADVPLLLCDIDGVISLFGFPLDAVPEGTWAQVDGIAHLLSPGAARHLHALAASYEIVWCSGWEDRANEHLPHLLAVGSYPHLSFPSPPEPGRHWKLSAIDAYAGRRPLAWVDDDLDDSCRAWARERPAPTLLVQTDPAVGLDEEAANRLLAWATTLR